MSDNKAFVRGSMRVVVEPTGNLKLETVHRGGFCTGSGFGHAVQVQRADRRDLFHALGEAIGDPPPPDRKIGDIVALDGMRDSPEMLVVDTFNDAITKEQFSICYWFTTERQGQERVFLSTLLRLVEP
jgi:hypothetical protein